MLGLGFAQPGPSVWSGSQWRTSQLFDGAKGIWPDGFNPYAGRVAQDAAGNLPAMLPGDPVGLIRRALGSVDASQPTALSRPLLGRHPKGGRRNTLLWSDDMSNALWSKSNASVSGDKIIESTDNTSHAVLQSIQTTNAAHTLSGEFQADGRSKVRLQFGTPARYAFFDLSTGGVSGMPAGATATITLLPDGWWRCQVSGVVDAVFSSAIIYLSPATNAGAYLGDGVSGVRARNLQFEAGAIATPYQKVTTALDVTEAGVPDVWYLQMDGIDDFLVTPNLAWGTDELTVVAALAPQGPSSGLLASTTTQSSTIPGSWFLQPYNAGGTGFPLFRSRGNGGAGAAEVLASSAIALNTPGILSARSKISAPLISLRVNGGPAAQNVADQGTGNYAADRPLHIGGRDGVANFMQGRLYDLLVINRRLTNAELARVETHMASKYGVTLA